MSNVFSKVNSVLMQDTLDAASHAMTMADVSKGIAELLASHEVALALAEPTPLAFWRRRRGFKQMELAPKVEISKGYLSNLEAGTCKGDPILFLRLARALNVRMEDLVDA
jgi:DNA-binding XRE family transcriptional regulator